MILKRELQISCFLSLSRDICTQIVDLSVFISTFSHVKKGRTLLLLTYTIYYLWFYLPVTIVSSGISSIKHLRSVSAI